MKLIEKIKWERDDLKSSRSRAVVESLFVESCLEARKTAAAQIILDLDATDDALRGRQGELLKIGTLVKLSVRRIKVAVASACPWQTEFSLAHARLKRAVT